MKKILVLLGLFATTVAMAQTNVVESAWRTGVVAPFSQNIASSTDGQTVATPGIDMSKYMKISDIPTGINASQVTQIVNDGITSGEIRVLSPGMPWTAYFLGQQKCQQYKHWYMNQVMNLCATILDNGNMVLSHDLWSGYSWTMPNSITYNYPLKYETITREFTAYASSWSCPFTNSADVIVMNTYPTGQTLFKSPSGWNFDFYLTIKSLGPAYCK